MAHLFDITEVKAGLRRKRDDLIAECKANQRLQVRRELTQHVMYSRRCPYASHEDATASRLTRGVRGSWLGQGKFDVIDSQMRASKYALDEEDEDEEEPPAFYGRDGLADEPVDVLEPSYLDQDDDPPPSPPGPPYGGYGDMGGHKPGPGSGGGASSMGGGGADSYFPPGKDPFSGSSASSSHYPSSSSDDFVGPSSGGRNMSYGGKGGGDDGPGGPSGGSSWDSPSSEVSGTTSARYSRTVTDY